MIPEKNVQFYVSFVRTRKKLEKYFKVNRIRNKQIIDIKKILDEEKLKLDSPKNILLFKVLIFSRIKTAREKGKDIYYIPNFTAETMDVSKLIKLKTTLLEHGDGFNFICFFDEFLGTNWLSSMLDYIDEFDNTQILKDY